ncbi:MAG: M20/M25/M40 family metallo-hydrolase [Byssovorax sp.]
MRRSISPLLLAALLAACGPPPSPPSPPPPLPPPVAATAAPLPERPLAIDLDPAGAARIASDVTLLASPELGGRGTGTEGARKAADFIAERYRALGLAPMGDHDGAGGEPSFFQRFSARIGASAKEAVLAVKVRKKPLDLQSISPGTAEGSESGTATGKALFVGHGITAPAASWDDYAGKKVDGQVVVVLDGTPLPPIKKDGAADKAQGVPAKKAAPQAPAALRDFGGVRYKIRTAREHGAAGVVIVARGDELPPPPADASGMGLPAIVLKLSDATRLFGPVVASPASWEPAKAASPRPLPVDSVSFTTRIDPVEAPAFNVAALLPARSPSAEHVIVGAHYDHLGMGGTAHSRAPGIRAMHPGADDNASGTALVLEVARRLAALPKRPAKNILFLSFSGEEIGLLGSRHWVEHPTVPLASVTAMINADMVGRLRDKHLLVDGVGTAAAWPNLLESASAGLDLDITFGSEGFGASDHASFTGARIPVAFFFTGVHADYHLPSDTADKINSEGEERIAAMVGRLALALAEKPEKLAFIDAPADPHRGAGGGFKVSLGTIPDYAFEGKGVRLTGVRPDAPAERGGMKAGDVIVKVGAHEVTNIHDYMFALGELEAGRAVVVEVLRDGARVPLNVIPAPGR